MDIDKKADLFRLSIRNSKSDRQSSKRGNLCYIECNEIDLIDIIDDVSICSFFSLDNLKEYAKSNGIVEYEKFDHDRTLNNRLKCNKLNHVNDQVHIFDCEVKSPFKYNTRSKNLTNDKQTDITKIKEKIVLPSYDCKNDVDIRTSQDEKFDHFLKKLDDILIVSDKKHNLENNFFENENYSYDEDLMIWQPLIRTKDYNFDIKKSIFKVSRSVSTCSTSSDSTNWSVKKSHLTAFNECEKDHCRLGCICDSLKSFNTNNFSSKINISDEKQNFSNANKFQNKVNISNLTNKGNNGIYRDHCGRIECMFECSCLRRLRSSTRFENDQKIEERQIKSNTNKKRIAIKGNIPGKKNNSKTFRVVEKNTKQDFESKKIFNEQEKTSKAYHSKSDYFLKSNQNFSSDNSRNSSVSYTTDDFLTENYHNSNKKLRKSKRVRYLKNVYKLSSSKNDSKINRNFNNKFKECYYYYNDNDLVGEKDNYKSKNFLSKIVDENNTNNNYNIKSTDKETDHKGKTTDTLALNRNNSFLNKEILSLIKLNSSINYDRNNKQRKTKRRYHGEILNDKYVQRFDHTITINHSNCQHKIDCDELKNEISKFKYEESNTPLEKKLLMKIITGNSENINIPINLKVTTSNSLKSIELILNLISKILKKLMQPDTKVQEWKELQFNYLKRFTISISSNTPGSFKQKDDELYDRLVGILPDISRKKLHGPINIHIKSYENSNESHSFEFNQNLCDGQNEIYNDLSNIFNSSSSDRSNLNYLLLKNNTIIKQFDTYKFDEKSKNSIKELSNKIDFSQNFSNPFHKYSEKSNSNLIFDQPKKLSNQCFENFEKNALNFSVITRNYNSNENVVKFIPRLLKKRNVSTKRDFNLEISNCLTENDINKAASTRLKLKNIDTILTKITHFPIVSSNKSFIKLLSLCKLNKTNSELMNGKNDNFERIFSKLSKFRSYRNSEDNLDSKNDETIYFSDEINYFKSKLYLEKNFKYPFYDPFTDTKLIISLYNQFKSTKLIDEVCETVNDTINVVSLFTNYNNPINELKKHSTAEFSKKIKQLTTVSSIKNYLEDSISQGENKKLNKTLDMINTSIVIEQSKNLSKIDPSSADATNLDEKETETPIKNYVRKHKFSKDKIVLRNLTPRILLRPKIIEIKNNTNNDCKTKIKYNPRLNFVPIRPRIISNYHNPINNIDKKNEKEILIENSKISDRKDKRKQDLKSINGILKENALQDSKELVDLNESRTYLEIEEQTKKNDHHFISTSSLFKHHNTNNERNTNDYDPFYDNSSDSLEFDEIYTENITKKNNDSQRDSNCSITSSSFSNKNSFSQDNNDIDQETNDSLSKKSESLSDDDHNYQINTSMSESNYFYKLKRPVSNSIHSIKERQRRLGLKKSFNKLKAELFVKSSDSSPIIQAKIEVNETYGKNLPKSKQKILMEVIIFLILIQNYNNKFQTQFNNFFWDFNFFILMNYNFH